MRGTLHHGWLSVTYAHRRDVPSVRLAGVFEFLDVDGHLTGP